MSKLELIVFDMRTGGAVEAKVALRPEKIIGLESEVDPAYTRIYYPRPGAKYVTVKGSVKDVLEIIMRVQDHRQPEEATA